MLKACIIRKIKITLFKKSASHTYLYRCFRVNAVIFDRSSERGRVVVMFFISIAAPCICMRIKVYYRNRPVNILISQQFRKSNRMITAQNDWNCTCFQNSFHFLWYRTKISFLSVPYIKISIINTLYIFTRINADSLVHAVCGKGSANPIRAKPRSRTICCSDIKWNTYNSVIRPRCVS